MTTVLLVRHAEHLLQSQALLGRTDGAPLSHKGREQMRLLGEVLAREPVAAVQSSPRERARQTAETIAAPHVLAVEICAALDEIDYGDWTGHSFDALQAIPEWHNWNRMRASTRPPRGESMLELQRRVLAHLATLRASYSGKTIVLVTHAEPIRAVLLHVSGIPLDEFARIDVAPGSITRLHLTTNEKTSLPLPEAFTV